MASHRVKLAYDFRLYLNNSAGKRIVGKGGAQILEAIEKYGSIVVAARTLGMSYRFVWNYLERAERILKQPVTITYRGGTSQGERKGGGGTKLTPLGKNLLRQYRTTERMLTRILSNRTPDLIH